MYLLNNLNHTIRSYVICLHQIQLWQPEFNKAEGVYQTIMLQLQIYAWTTAKAWQNEIALFMYMIAKMLKNIQTETKSCDQCR